MEMSLVDLAAIEDDANLNRGAAFLHPGMMRQVIRGGSLPTVVV